MRMANHTNIWSRDSDRRMPLQHEGITARMPVWQSAPPGSLPPEVCK